MDFVMIFLISGIFSMVFGFKVGNKFGAWISKIISSPGSGVISVAILVAILLFIGPRIGQIALVNIREPLSLIPYTMLIIGLTSFGFGALGGRAAPKKSTNISNNGDDNSQ